VAFGQYSGGFGAVVGAIIGAVIGYEVGSPYQGAMLGASLGGMAGGIAGQVFWPDKVDLTHPLPPKPHETRVQISTYGAPIPIQYEDGRMAGNIIYMSDVVETVERSKHRQDGVRYYEMVKTYTATFAIAFCEAVGREIARIWVNGKVFADYRDPTSPYYPVGDAGLSTANLETSIARSDVWFSLYPGSETQTYDPAIAAILTAAETPAYRGICYAVFRDFPVGEFSGVPTIEVELAEKSLWLPFFNNAYWQAQSPSPTYGIWTTDHWADADVTGDIRLLTIGTWFIGYRPTQMRLTINSPAPIAVALIKLYDGFFGGVIASYGGSISAGTTQLIFDISFSGIDLGTLEVNDTSNTVHFTITNIEFM
jgi:hypothetical protein